MMEPMHIISLGAGVQSSTMALMAAHGEITPMPECAIFADTHSEPKAVYEWLRYLKTKLPFPVNTVSQGDLREHVAAERPKGKFLRVDIPAFVKGANGQPGGMVNRSCTRDYKIVPIIREVRRLTGLTRKRGPKTPIVMQWIGISLDEAHRMKPSREAWIENRWPLVDKRMKREDCLRWMKANGYPEPPKSSCTFCPFHSADQWRALTTDEMAEAIAIDERLRSRPPSAYRKTGTLYLHRSCKPLREVDFTPEPVDFFGNECEGMCGV